MQVSSYTAPMSWHAAARRAAQSLGLDPRYVRRLRWASKAKAVRRVGAPLRGNLAFVLSDPEPDNFTYALQNETELAAWLAAVTNADAELAARLIDEARRDAVLATRLHDAAARRWLWTKPAPPLGKRLAWYALARLLRPALIVETGVHDGLGSLVLLRALELNGEEGHAGSLLSFDVNPAAGWLVGSHPLWELRIQSTTDGLELLERRPPVGLFIHDSLHTYEHERFEFEVATARMSTTGVLLTDNAHGTRALADVCREAGLCYFDFHEVPADHFYPGGAMGAGRRCEFQLQVLGSALQDQLSSVDEPGS